MAYIKQEIQRKQSKSQDQAQQSEQHPDFVPVYETRLSMSQEQEEEYFRGLSLRHKQPNWQIGQSHLYLIPCPLNHDNSQYQIYTTKDNIPRIRCDCNWPNLMNWKIPFSSMVYDVDVEMDYRPHRAVNRNQMKMYDPSIQVELFIPNNVDTSECWKKSFSGNQTFRRCERNHKSKRVCLINAPRLQTILVCGCQDQLQDFKRVPFSKQLMEKYGQTEVFEYFKPERRGYTATPVKGWAKQC